MWVYDCALEARIIKHFLRFSVIQYTVTRPLASLTQTFARVFREDEIHRLRKLRREGFPERLSCS